MDSRQKICRGPQAIERLQQLSRPQVVSALFDPLLPSTASRLKSLKRPGASLVVVLGESVDPILASQARAELVAALRCVDLVIIPDGVSLPVELSLGEEHQIASGEFVRHVLERMS